MSLVLVTGGFDGTMVNMTYPLWTYRSEVHMRTRPVSFVKAHLAEVIDRVREDHDPLVITQNGASTAVIIDHESFDRMRQAMLMLKLVAMGEQDIAKGRTVPQAEVFRDIRRRLKNQADARVRPKRR